MTTSTSTATRSKQQLRRIQKVLQEVAAALLRAPDAALALARLMGVPQANPWPGSPADTLREIRLWQFTSNDLIHLPNGLAGAAAFAAPKLQINGQEPVDLSPREFLVLRSLLCQRLTDADQGAALLPPAHLGFVRMSDLLAQVEHDLKECLANGSVSEAAWKYPTADDVRKVIDSLRDKIESAGGKRETLQNKPGKGYRINTPRHNLLVATEGLSRPDETEPNSAHIP